MAGLPIPFRNHKSLHKQKCRDFILSEVLNKFPNNKKLNVCTLPNTNYFLESNIRNNYNTKLFLVEKDINIASSIATYWAGVPNVYIYNDDLFKIVNKLSNHLDVIWADLCSPLTVDMINKIYNMAFNNNTKPCILACTFMSCREPSVSLSNMFKTDNLESIRNVKFPEFISKTGFQLENIIKYNSNMGAAMSTYLFKI